MAEPIAGDADKCALVQVDALPYRGRAIHAPCLDAPGGREKPPLLPQLDSLTLQAYQRPARANCLAFLALWALAFQAARKDNRAGDAPLTALGQALIAALLIASV
jgi:hypothetical protein